MKRILVLLIALVFSLSMAAQRVLPPPNPARLVNDAANLLTPDQVATLEAKLVAYDDSTSNQIVVVTVPTLNGLDPNDYATELGRSWGVGGKEFNNGVVVLISTGTGEGEKRSVYISAGYGLEGALPDIILKQIIEAEMVPNLKAGNYYRAVDEATDALIKAAAGEYKAPAGYHQKKETGVPVGFIIFIIIIVLVFISRRGGGGGGMMSRRGFGGVPPIFFPGGGGGGWSGGGGGGGGGGFGGFGGGSFGGGGAGGNW